MRDAGFVEVEDRKVPIGTWARQSKELGRIHLSEMLNAVEPYTLALYTKVLGKSLDETKVTIEMVKRDLHKEIPPLRQLPLHHCPEA